MYSLSTLLVWKGSETSHHLGDDRENFVVSYFALLAMLIAFTIIITTSFRLKEYEERFCSGDSSSLQCVAVSCGSPRREN